MNHARALQLATSRFDSNDPQGRANRRNNPHPYYDQFCLDYAITIIDTENLSFISTADFLAEVNFILVHAHNRLNLEKTLTWRGRTNPNYIRFSAIPVAHQPAIRNLINNNLPAPGHDRGVHLTSPSLGANGAYREFDLTLAAAGRATKLTRPGGRRAIYYSRHHAANTYEYLLVTDNHGRPYLRGGPIMVGRAALLSVPL
jgi:hypothetical protein